MVVFIDRSVTLGTTPFEYNFGANTQFFANLINSVPGQINPGPPVVLRVFMAGLGHQDIDVPYGTPIIQLGLVGNKVQLIGNGATVAITLSSSPLPLSATDIGQLSLYSKQLQYPVISSSGVVASGATANIGAVTAGQGVLLVVVASNASVTADDDQGNLFVELISDDFGGNAFYNNPGAVTILYSENLKADPSYTITLTGYGANVGFVWMLLDNAPISGRFIDSVAVYTATVPTGTGESSLGSTIVISQTFELNINVTVSSLADANQSPPGSIVLVQNTVLGNNWTLNVIYSRVPSPQTITPTWGYPQNASYSYGVIIYPIGLFAAGNNQ